MLIITHAQRVHNPRRTRKNAFSIRIIIFSCSTLISRNNQVPPKTLLIAYSYIHGVIKWGEWI